MKERKKRGKEGEEKGKRRQKRAFGWILLLTSF